MNYITQWVSTFPKTRIHILEHAGRRPSVEQVFTLLHVHMFAYQGVMNVAFSENFAYVLNE